VGLLLPRDRPDVSDGSEGRRGVGEEGEEVSQGESSFVIVYPTIFEQRLAPTLDISKN
jgi:hypothetical protein